MKALFYTGLIGLAVFEVLKVYFIMPMPGSQGIESLGIAYSLHSFRWLLRLVFAALLCVGFLPAFKTRHPWIPALAILAAAAVIYFFNFQMTAERIFRQPETLTLQPRSVNALNDSSLVIGVALNGEARAYPVRFLAYHHQVRDTVGGKSIIVTYCSVCRTGRVFEPVVRGRNETFRLVGMDHYNAMFEDARTGSWWRQATGEAVAGKLKGEALPEVESSQMTLGEWFALYPDAMVMQADEASRAEYDPLARFERGRSRGALTRTDSRSWQDKSWVVGIHAGGVSKAYDWNRLRAERLINDTLGRTAIVLALGSDDMSFAAFERPSASSFTVNKDTLFSAGTRYDLAGRSLTTPSRPLKAIAASQEFWHSWWTFHPKTLRY